MSEAALQRLRNWGAESALVLGSGLGVLIDHVDASSRIAYAEFSDLPTTKVAGHAGEFALGEINGRRLIFAKGRVHLYEG
ncbi:MAG: purine-nucleoside phosphorylase, partial [Chthoniobacterales bacterium]